MDRTALPSNKIVRCPQCHHTLDKDFLCQSCHIQYTIKNGIANLLVPEQKDFNQTEQRFWDYTYQREGKRSLDKRNFYYHEHFRRPLLNLPDRAVILEVGCGNRADSMELAMAGKRVIATDVSLQALMNARQLAEEAKLSESLEFIAADAEQLPFHDSSFDGALIAAALHHLQDPLIGLQEMKRVVKNGGIISIGVEPASWPYYTIFKILSPIKHYIRQKRQRQLNSIADDTTNGFSRRQLKKLLTQADLEIIEIRPVKYSLEIYDSYRRLVERLTHRSSNPSLRIQTLLSQLDQQIEKIPLLNYFSWHWNIISRVRK